MSNLQQEPTQAHAVYVQNRSTGRCTHLGIYENPTSANYNRIGLERRFGVDPNLEVIHNVMPIDEAARIFMEIREDYMARGREYNVNRSS